MMLHRVKLDRHNLNYRCLLVPEKQTCIGSVGMSEKCQ